MAANLHHPQLQKYGRFYLMRKKIRTLFKFLKRKYKSGLQQNALQTMQNLPASSRIYLGRRNHRHTHTHTHTHTQRERDTQHTGTDTQIQTQTQTQTQTDRQTDRHTHTHTHAHTHTHTFKATKVRNVYILNKN